MSRKTEDLTGKKYGRLEVVKRVDDYVSDNGKKFHKWLCKCECGKETIVKGQHLRSGHTRSCGCMQKERAKQVMSDVFKKYNRYDLSNGYGKGYTSNGEEFLFDIDDYDKIKPYCWWINEYGYVIANVKKKKISLHRFVMNAPTDKQVDHINCIRNDNRKHNLRICTCIENSRNKGLMANNTSGVTGVCWDKRINKWIAQIGLNYKVKCVGRFDTKEEAIKARQIAERKYFGEFRYNGYSESSYESVGD